MEQRELLLTYAKDLEAVEPLLDRLLNSHDPLKEEDFNDAPR